MKHFPPLYKSLIKKKKTLTGILSELILNLSGL